MLAKKLIAIVCLFPLVVFANEYDPIPAGHSYYLFDHFEFKANQVSDCEKLALELKNELATGPQLWNFKDAVFDHCDAQDVAPYIDLNKKYEAWYLKDLSVPDDYVAFHDGKIIGNYELKFKKVSLFAYQRPFKVFDRNGIQIYQKDLPASFDTWKGAFLAFHSDLDSFDNLQGDDFLKFIASLLNVTHGEVAAILCGEKRIEFYWWGEGAITDDLGKSYNVTKFSCVSTKTWNGQICQ